METASAGVDGHWLTPSKRPTCGHRMPCCVRLFFEDYLLRSPSRLKPLVASTVSSTPISLPAHPTDKDFEEHVAACFQCAGRYVERSIIERDIKEVLELDIISTDYGCTPPDIRLAEIKSGSWGFPDIFKVFGWLHYLEIGRGTLIVKTVKESEAIQTFYRLKGEELNIDIVVVDTVDVAARALVDLLKSNPIDPEIHSLWRFSYWIERNLLKRLTAQKKASPPGTRRFEAMDRYLFSVNSEVFFTKNAIDRAQTLYGVFKEIPRLSARCAHEESGGSFDSDVSTIEMSAFNKAFYKCQYTDIQISTYIEHRARLTILKAAIDHLLYERAGEFERAGTKAKASFGGAVLNAPRTFVDGLEIIARHTHFHRYAVFWQCFLWLFGGFILQDYEDSEYKQLSALTGVPIAEIPNAFMAFDILFPTEKQWFREIKSSSIRIISPFPVPFRGIGANLRKELHLKGGELADLALTGEHTLTDLIKWNNLAVEVLSKY